MPSRMSRCSSRRDRRTGPIGRSRYWSRSRFTVSLPAVVSDKPYHGACHLVTLTEAHAHERVSAQLPGFLPKGVAEPVRRLDPIAPGLHDRDFLELAIVKAWRDGFQSPDGHVDA